MCGRYVRRSDKQAIAEHYRVRHVPDFPLPPDYNIAPTTFQPIIRQERNSDEREIVLARWGLVPFFAESLAAFKGFSTFNARAESIMSSAIWRGPFKNRRCLVPADGFYEWATEHIKPTAVPMTQRMRPTKKPKKTAFAIQFKSGEPMAFAGLWDAWKEPKPKGGSIHSPDTWLQSFSIITTEANELMATIHTRMPVILAERDWKRWLDRDPDAPPPIDLLRPFDSDAMQAAPCNPGVGKVKNNGPEMLVCPAPGILPLNSA